MKSLQANVLIDAYNIDLSFGTGIKTYGLTLIDALNQLGANTSLLYGKDIITDRKNPLIRQVQFFDRTSKKSNLKNKVEILLKTLFQIPIVIKPIVSSQDNLVINPNKSSLKNISDFYNVSLCYELSNQVFQKISLDLLIKQIPQCDIFHATYPLPIKVKGAKKITTIHDLIPLKLPYLTLDNKKFFYRLIKHSLKTSDLIITVSENSKKDIIETFDYPEDKIVVTYQPINLPTKLNTPEEVTDYLKKYNLKYQNYILFVGAIEPKKNIKTLIDAYVALNSKFPLVIVGKKAWGYEEDLEKINLYPKKIKKKIIFLNYINKQELKNLFQGAYCFVFPSLYEGFGLPPLEAMTLGCPVITSNTSCLQEVCGDASLFVNPYSVEELYHKLKIITYDLDLRQSLIEKGKKRAMQFNPQIYQQKLLSAYQKVLHQA